MRYFKNTELAKLHNVSEKSVRNWIDAAENGKLDLQLYQQGNKLFIANTSKNITVIGTLVEKGKKYRNTRGFKLTSPKPEFYKLFDSKETLNITSNLDVHHEIPLQYCYFDGGASIWDKYIQKLAKENEENILTNTMSLLGINLDYLEGLLKDSKRINIIDIGPGNAYPVRGLVEYFLESGRLNRYIAIDVSRDMLNIAKRNMCSWFGDSLLFESYVRDITYERFSDILAVDSFIRDEPVRNLVLFFGSTLSNFRDPSQPLSAIRESMGKRDLLLFTKQLDTPNARRYFDFDIEPNSKAKISPLGRFTFELLGIDESLYEVEQFFDERSMERRLQVRLSVAISVEFELNGRHKILNFNKGDVILFWRHRHQNALQTIEQFDKNGFSLLQAATSADGECLLSISKIKLDLEQ
ncbi:MAG TPA: L-histidine N(alpha)-methyltransferase [Candidatus Saccharimonadales bacterium]|nr:L-histidine N(alpha)-methyltransferase [Candidatus Saccharimonadales bacterium]